MKKAEFSRLSVSPFPDGWQVIWSRAEDAGRGSWRESFDLVTARAVASMRSWPSIASLGRVGGVFLALKGPEGAKELDDAARAIEVLGGQVEKTVPVLLPRALEKGP